MRIQSIVCLFITTVHYLFARFKAFVFTWPSPNGTITIQSNAPGCNSPEEVEEACDAIASCLPEGIVFTTQTQIDSFQINYPGCTEIEGDVGIGLPLGTDITNLYGLNVLNTIEGDLIILCNSSITDLTGLDNLTSIGGNLTIIYNNALTSLRGLENLTSIGGGFGYMAITVTTLIGLE